VLFDIGHECAIDLYDGCTTAYLFTASPSDSG
jgi:hypothetical protein